MTKYRYRADPVALKAGMSQVYCLGSGPLQLSPSEAQALVADINGLLEPGMRLEIGPKAHCWYWHTERVLELDTTALDKVVHANILPYLPQGPDAPKINRLLTEIQMLLNAHPVNMKRKEQGLVTVDSLWLWQEPGRWGKLVAHLRK